MRQREESSGLILLIEDNTDARETRRELLHHQAGRGHRPQPNPAPGPAPTPNPVPGPTPDPNQVPVPNPAPQPNPTEGPQFSAAPLQ